MTPLRRSGGSRSSCMPAAAPARSSPSGSCVTRGSSPPSAGPTPTSSLSTSIGAASTRSWHGQPTLPMPRWSSPATTGMPGSVRWHISASRGSLAVAPAMRSGSRRPAAWRSRGASPTSRRRSPSRPTSSSTSAGTSWNGLRRLTASFPCGATSGLGTLRPSANPASWACIAKGTAAAASRLRRPRSAVTRRATSARLGGPPRGRRRRAALRWSVEIT